MDRDTASVMNRAFKGQEDKLQAHLISVLEPLVQAIQIMEARIRYLELPVYRRVWGKVKVFWAACRVKLTSKKESATVVDE